MAGRWRFVKVQTIRPYDSTQIEEFLKSTYIDGKMPQFKEIPDDSTISLDMDTVWDVIDRQGNKYTMHQVTIPLPMDDFPRMLRSPVQHVGEAILYDVLQERHWDRSTYDTVDNVYVSYRDLIAFLNNRECD